MTPRNLPRPASPNLEEILAAQIHVLKSPHRHYRVAVDRFLAFLQTDFPTCTASRNCAAIPICSVGFAAWAKKIHRCPITRVEFISLAFAVCSTTWPRKDSPR